METSVKLMQRFAIHLRATGGSTYGYNVLDADAGDRKIGSKSSWVPTGRSVGRHKPRTVFTLSSTGVEFDTAEEFTKAYEHQLRDEEFDAADPELKNHSNMRQK